MDLFAAHTALAVLSYVVLALATRSVRPGEAKAFIVLARAQRAARGAA